MELKLSLENKIENPASCGWHLFAMGLHKALKQGIVIHLITVIIILLYH